jgi:hypothetical protein
MSKKTINTLQCTYIFKTEYNNPIPLNIENNCFNEFANINISINNELEMRDIINPSSEEKLNTDGINNVKQLSSNYNNIDDINLANNQNTTSFNNNNINNSDSSFYVPEKNPLDPTILKKLKVVEINDKNQISKIEYDCVICQKGYELKDKYIKLPCKHIYHENCIKTWLKKKNVCPICKQNIKINDTKN